MRDSNRGRGQIRGFAFDGTGERVAKIILRKKKKAGGVRSMLEGEGPNTPERFPNSTGKFGGQRGPLPRRGMGGELTRNTIQKKKQQ